MKQRILTTAAVAFSAMSFQVDIANANSIGWPGFLGPNRDGVSTETGLLKKWPQSGPKELWKLDVGDGFGGASIVGDDVYILDRPDVDHEILRCLDFKTGKQKWQHRYNTQKVKLPHAGSRSTPQVDGDFVYTYGRLANLNCVNRKTRKAVWSRDLMKDYGFKATSRWGFSASPLVVGDIVIVPAHDQDGGHLIGINKHSGKTVWERKDVGGAHYVSPRIYEIHGVKQAITFGKIGSDGGRFTSVDPQTGRELWRYDGYFNKIMIPMPTNMGDGRLFITGGYGCGSVMIRLNKRGNGYSIKELFRIDDEGSQMHQAHLHNGHLYVNWNTNENLKKGKKHLGGLACLDPDSGKILWRTGEDPSFERGPLLFADGMIIILDGELGELALVDPSPGGYNELARAKVFTKLKNRGNKIWSAMALTDGKLIVRSQTELKCFSLK